MMKKLIIILLGSLSVGLLCTTVGLLSFNAGKKQTKVVAVDFTVEEETEQEIGVWKYQFLKKELSDYICGLCNEMEINSDLIVAILMKENPEFNPEATHRNENGTIDVGMFQLNDRYVWTTFKDSYWFDNVELDPFNWKHNTYLAVHHIEYLQKQLKVMDDVIMAYNCGIGAVMNGDIPDRTKSYYANVKLNMKLLNKED
jgi:hypothetical protein